MPDIQITLKTVTPLFLAGADGATPELRPASFRGVLRFWLRALLGGALGDDLRAIKMAEASVFGSTDGASAVALRVLTDAKRLGHRGHRPLPHNPSKSFRFEGWDSGQSFTLHMSTRPGVLSFPDGAIASLALMIGLGGLGRRSRRGFGSLQVQSSRTSSETALSSEAEQLISPQLTSSETLVAYMGRLVTWAQAEVCSGTTKAWSDLPSFPVFDSDYACVVVCRHPFDSWERAMRAFWGRLRSQPYRDVSVFGFVDHRKRRASPLFVKIWQVGGQYCLVLTAFRSKLFPGQSAAWGVMGRFLNECEKEWRGAYVLGGKEVW
jgi:CRISPR type III-B/RAMP module RAMP protein Cmr1